MTKTCKFQNRIISSLWELNLWFLMLWGTSSDLQNVTLTGYVTMIVYVYCFSFDFLVVGRLMLLGIVRQVGKTGISKFPGDGTRRSHKRWFHLSLVCCRAEIAAHLVFYNGLWEMQLSTSVEDTEPVHKVINICCSCGSVTVGRVIDASITSAVGLSLWAWNIVLF